MIYCGVGAFFPSGEKGGLKNFVVQRAGDEKFYAKTSHEVVPLYSAGQVTSTSLEIGGVYMIVATDILCAVPVTIVRLPLTRE